jgi:hypothetical protein
MRAKRPGGGKDTLETEQKKKVTGGWAYEGYHAYYLSFGDG